MDLLENENSDRVELLHEKMTRRIICCFYDVYNELGFGFLESVYQKAVRIALQADGLFVETEKPIPVFFHGHPIGKFEADLVVENLVILELKAAEKLYPVHEAQLLNYLKATTIEIGYLMNFGPKPTFKRLIFDNPRKKSRPRVVQS